MTPNLQKQKRALKYYSSSRFPVSGAHGARALCCGIHTLTLQPLFFLRKTAGETLEKARVLLFAEPLKSLERKAKTHKKTRNIRKGCDSNYAWRLKTNHE